MRLSVKPPGFTAALSRTSTISATTSGGLGEPAALPACFLHPHRIDRDRLARARSCSKLRWPPRHNMSCTWSDVGGTYGSSLVPCAHAQSWADYWFDNVTYTSPGRFEDQMLKSRKGRALASLMRLDRLLTETDAPFVRDRDRPLVPWHAYDCPPELGTETGVDSLVLARRIREHLRNLPTALRARMAA